MKKIIPVLVLLTVALSISAAKPFAYTGTAFAASFAEPYYNNEVRTSTLLQIANGTASCYSSADADSAIVKITGEQYLQKQGFLWIWSTYDGAEWTKTVNASTISMSNSKSGLTGGKYRLKTVFTLTDKNGKTETITIYSDEKTIG